ncbi:hypothetical protein PilKf_01479 [Pillotina sp. SPG140]
MYGQEEQRMTTVHPAGQACGFSFFHKGGFSIDRFRGLSL